MKVGVLVSGQGTNLQALLDAEAAGKLAPATIAIVISNKPGVPALARAEKAGVPAEVIEHGTDRMVFEDALSAALARHGVELVVLAGFMRVLTAHFVDRWPLRIINTHPSLLPAFAGAKAAEQAIAHGVKVSGMTIHFVDSSLDGGPIIAQEPVPIFEGDDAAALQARIQIREHQMLPEVVRDLATGALSCQGRLVVRKGTGAQQ
jgi:phosphoribosylglycinamide formyltransferase-1